MLEHIDHSPSPSENGLNGRDALGRFAPGWKGGPGCPPNLRIAHWRKVAADAVTDDDIRDVIRALIQAAKGGDVAAAREVLNRTLGKVPDLLEIDPARRETMIQMIQIGASEDV